MFAVSGTLQKKSIQRTLRPGMTLYVGNTCHDGRPIEQSWRYKEALRMNLPIVREETERGKEEKKEVKEELWTDKYAPTRLEDVIGHRQEIQEILDWLSLWDTDPKALKQRAVLITGPPGIGKTTVAHLVGKRGKYAVAEYNASDVRSISLLKGQFGLGMKRLRRELIVMDEVDGLSERGGVVELASLIQRSLVPILCIANEKSQKLAPLVRVCLEVPFRRPLRTSIATAMMSVVKKEGLSISKAELEEMCEKNGNDLRAILNQLSFYQKDSDGSGNKDIQHRMEPFSATCTLLREKRLGWDDAMDQVYVDPFLVPLMIQETYAMAARNEMEDLAWCADRLSEGDVLNKRLLGSQDWSLLPHVVSVPVSVAKRVSGGAPRQIFPQMLGKMSKRTKHQNWLSDMGRRIGVRGSSLRLDYAETLRVKSTEDLKKGDVKGAIRAVKDLGLERDDVMETLVETVSLFPMEPIPTKTKTAFTREWNKREGGSSGKKRKSVEELELQEDEEEEVEDLVESFEELSIE